MPPGGVEEVARRHDRVHERVRKGLLPSAGSQMKDDGGASDRRVAVVLRQEIPFDHFDSGAPVAAGQRVDSRPIGGRPGEAAHVAEPTVQQTLDHTAADETGSSSHEDPIAGADYVVHWFSGGRYSVT